MLTIVSTGPKSVSGLQLKFNKHLRNELIKSSTTMKGFSWEMKIKRNLQCIYAVLLQLITPVWCIFTRTFYRWDREEILLTTIPDQIILHWHIAIWYHVHLQRGFLYLFPPRSSIFLRNSFKSSDMLFYSVASLSISFQFSNRYKVGQNWPLASATVYKHIHQHPQLGEKMLHHVIIQK